VPPRFAYWTILIDNAPTAFRARDQQELVPTLHQLKRTNKDVSMKWFARGRLWDSQDQEREDFTRRKRSTQQRAGTAVASGDRRQQRGKDWRPGGKHKDPRERFASRKSKHRKPHRVENVRAKSRHERPPKHEEPRRDRPERRDNEPVPRRDDRRADTVPEPPPPAEQIVIKPEPPERG
jgi:hypothetical protein